MPDISGPAEELSDQKSARRKLVLVGIITLAFVVLIIILFFQLFIQSNSSPIPSVEIKKASPSANQTTPSATNPSAQKSETEGWKTYTEESNDIIFSLKYPPNFVEYKPNEIQGPHIISNMISILGNFKEGDVLITITSSTSTSKALSKRSGVEYSDSYLDGLQVKKGIGEDSGVGIVQFYINGVFSVNNSGYFELICDYYPSSDKELKTICENIVSTFRFD